AKSTATQTVPASPDWNLELEAKVYNGSTLISTLVAKPQDLLKQQIAQGKGVRLNGAVATEYTVVAPLKDSATNAEHPHLTARLHTRLYEGGARIRTDMVLENNWTYKANPGNITYELTVRRNGQVVHTQPRFTHNHHARWHKVLWTGSTDPQVRLRHNMPYFLASRATWNYDLSLKVPESVLAEEARTLAASNTAPMGPAMLQTYFPTTGSRWDIGPVPRWTALYLVTQDDRARASMMANADAAAGVPVHYRDEKTDHPVSLDSYPTISTLYGTSSPALPKPTGTTVWEPDTAHQASFAYIPYLVSGDAFYLDEMMFWSSWNIAAVDPYFRKDGQGLVRWDQLRGQAWVMRSIWEAQAALPDTHAMKAYFKTKLAANLTDYATYFKAGNTATSPLGPMTTELTMDGQAAPWQNDFMAIVLSLMAENGETQAKSALDWISPFTVGRYNKESEGFCAAKAPGYYWYVKDTAGKFITSWSALFARNYPSAVGQSCNNMPILTEAYPDCADCYAANSRAMMGASANAGVANAAATYTRWKALTPKLDAAFAVDPNWAIVPR
uniref:hypothetical protein n=1 Tax=Hydrogenophaga sp. 2FB TaxID=2502187 RepID=UPI001485A9E0